MHLPHRPWSVLPITLSAFWLLCVFIILSEREQYSSFHVAPISKISSPFYCIDSLVLCKGHFSSGEILPKAFYILFLSLMCNSYTSRVNNKDTVWKNWTIWAYVYQIIKFIGQRDLLCSVFLLTVLTFQVGVARFHIRRRDRRRP